MKQCKICKNITDVLYLYSYKTLDIESMCDHIDTHYILVCENEQCRTKVEESYAYNNLRIAQFPTIFCDCGNPSIPHPEGPVLYCPKCDKVVLMGG